MPFSIADRTQLPADGAEVLLVRHGQSVANAQGVAQGRADYPLSDKGRRQAALTAAHIARLGGVSAVYTSPLSRAADTAAAIGERLGLTPIPVETLVETDLGVLSGLTWSELAARYPEAVEAYESAEQHKPHPKNRELLPGYEPIEQVLARVWEAVLGLVERHPGERIVVVAHGGVLNGFLTHLLTGDARETPWRHHGTNCSLTHLVFAPGGPQVRCLLDTAHLAAERSEPSNLFSRRARKQEELP